MGPMGSHSNAALSTRIRILMKTETSSTVVEKIRVHKWRIRIVFARPHENAKTTKTQQHPLKGMRCIKNDIIVLNWEASVFVLSSRRFQKSCFFGARYAVYVRRGPETKGLTRRWQSQRLLFTLFTSCFTNER